MPARKPSTLSTRHSTKADREEREGSEAAMLPKTLLGKSPPSALTGHTHARATWSRLVGLYFETEGTIITAFDSDLLIKYCLAEEELHELTKLRKEIAKLWEVHTKLLSKLKPNNENLKDYFGALGAANALLQRFQGMDARLDGKRKMLVTIAQSLYLTPRSRAGVAIPEKEPEEPESDMDRLLKVE
jgi:phage terminase small subunit